MFEHITSWSAIDSNKKNACPILLLGHIASQLFTLCIWWELLHMREMIYLGSQVVIHWNATADKMLLNQNQKKIKLHLTISYAASRCQFDKQHRQYLDTYPPCRSCVVRPLDVEYDTSSTSLPSWEGLAAAFPILDEILGSGSSSRWHSLLLGQASNACFHYCLFCLCILLVIQNR